MLISLAAGAAAVFDNENDYILKNFPLLYDSYGSCYIAGIPAASRLLKINALFLSVRTACTAAPDPVISTVPQIALSDLSRKIQFKNLKHESIFLYSSCHPASFYNKKGAVCCADRSFFRQTKSDGIRFFKTFFLRRFFEAVILSAQSPFGKIQTGSGIKGRKISESADILQKTLLHQILKTSYDRTYENLHGEIENQLLPKIKSNKAPRGEQSHFGELYYYSQSKNLSSYFSPGTISYNISESSLNLSPLFKESR